MTQHEPEPKRAYKIVMIGDAAVGKTSIRRNYMGKSFRTDYLKTIGADFTSKRVTYDNETILLTLWDMAGQSIFHGMRSSFYQGCKCAIVVFEVTDRTTLANTLKWAEEASTYAKSSLQEIYLIGNKIDLVNQRIVELPEIQEYAKKIQKKTNLPVTVYQTSALTGENIQQLFLTMSKRLIHGVDAEKVRKDLSISTRSSEEMIDTKEFQSQHKSKEQLLSELPAVLTDIEDTIDKLQSIKKTIDKILNNTNTK